MTYAIREISTHKGSEMLYVLADFGSVKEEFLMQIAAQGSRQATDKDGFYLLQDGSSVDPAKLSRDNAAQYEKIGWVYETFAVDVKAEILANLDRFDAHVQAGKFAGDLTAKGGQAIQRDKSDPQGILAQPDVQTLVEAVAVDHP